MPNSIIPQQSAQAAGATYYVAPNGSDSAAGSQSAPFKTIAKAATAAGAGDTVLVRAGTYNGQTTFTKSGTASAYITIKAAPGATPKVVASGKKYAFDFAGKSYIRVEGFDVSGSQSHLFRLESAASTGNVIAKNVMHNTTSRGDGVRIMGAKNTMVLNNKMHHVQYGVKVERTSTSAGSNAVTNTVIRGNEVYKPGVDCIYLAGPGVTVDRNYLHDNNETYSAGEHADGVQVYLAAYTANSRIVFSNNKIDLKDQPGSQRQCNSLMLENAGGITIFNNVVYGRNESNGINLKSCPNSKVFNNTVVDVANYTIYVHKGSTVASSNVLVYNNITPGIKLNSDGSQSGYKADNNLIGGDAQFVNKAAADFRIKAGSPAVDKGYANADKKLPYPSTDNGGGQRIVNGKIDIGAYEIGAKVAAVSETVPTPAAEPVADATGTGTKDTSVKETGTTDTTVGDTTTTPDSKGDSDTAVPTPDVSNDGGVVPTSDTTGNGDTTSAPGVKDGKTTSDKTVAEPDKKGDKKPSSDKKKKSKKAVKKKFKKKSVKKYGKNSKLNGKKSDNAKQTSELKSDAKKEAAVMSETGDNALTSTDKSSDAGIVSTDMSGIPQLPETGADAIAEPTDKVDAKTDAAVKTDEKDATDQAVKADQAEMPDKVDSAEGADKTGTSDITDPVVTIDKVSTTDTAAKTGETDMTTDTSIGSRKGTGPYANEQREPDNNDVVSAKGDSVSIKWNKPAKGTPKYYKIFASPKTGTGAEEYVTSVPATETAFTHKGLKKFDRKWYKVVAAYGNGQSTYSDCAMGQAGTTRYQEDNSNVKAVGKWSRVNEDDAAGLNFRQSKTAGSYIDITFKGTDFALVGFGGPSGGIAKIYIDGKAITDGSALGGAGIDMYAADWQRQGVAYEKTGLTDGTHKVRIEVTGKKNARSRGNAVSFDAIDFGSKTAGQ